MRSSFILNAVDVSTDDTVVPDGSPSLHNDFTDFKVNLNKLNSLLIVALGAIQLFSVLGSKS
jgi:hypothetical protein